MKYFKVIFSDYSETVGEYKTRADAERGARHYCEVWNLSETVREVSEITLEEYSRKTGKPAPVAAKEEKPKKNRIPRKAKKIYITWLIDTTGHKTGDRATVEKDDNGQWIETTESGKTYLVFVSMLRNRDVIQVDGIEMDEEPQTVTTDPATISDKETYRSKAADSQNPLYIVQCKSSRRPWTDYSSPATLEKCETIKARAEARRTCNTSGELLTYRIITATTSEESPEDVQTDTRSQEEPARAETGTTGAPYNDGPTAGESCTMNDERPTTGDDCTTESTTGSQETPTETAKKDASQTTPKTAPPRHENPKAEQTTTNRRKEPPQATGRDEARTHGPPRKAAAASQIPKRKHCKIKFYGPKIFRKDFCSSFRHHFRIRKFQGEKSRPPGGYQKNAV